MDDKGKLNTDEHEGKAALDNTRIHKYPVLVEEPDGIYAYSHPNADNPEKWLVAQPAAHPERWLSRANLATTPSSISRTETKTRMTGGLDRSRF